MNCISLQIFEFSKNWYVEFFLNQNLPQFLPSIHKAEQFSVIRKITCIFDDCKKNHRIIDVMNEIFIKFSKFIKSNVKMKANYVNNCSKKCISHSKQD